MEWPNADAPKEHHLAADRGHHPPDLAVLPLLEGDHQPGWRLWRFVETTFGWACGLRGGGTQAFAFAFDATDEPLEVVLRRRPVQAHEVVLRHFVAGVCEEVGEMAVIREDEEAFAVHIEAANGMELNIADRDEVEDGFAVLLVAGRGHESGRLVQGEVAIAAAVDGDTIEGDLVCFGVGSGTKGRLLDAIHCDTAFSDEQLSRAARCNARIG